MPGIEPSRVARRGVQLIELVHRLAAERDKEGTRPHVTENRVYRYWDRWLTGGEIPHLVVVDSEVADGVHSVILDQVTNGLAVRMAVLYLCGGIAA